LARPSATAAASVVSLDRPGVRLSVTPGQSDCQQRSRQGAEERQPRRRRRWRSHCSDGGDWRWLTAVWTATTAARQLAGGLVLPDAAPLGNRCRLGLQRSAAACVQY
jgi:hypothetical protein